MCQAFHRAAPEETCPAFDRVHRAQQLLDALGGIAVGRLLEVQQMVADHSQMLAGLDDKILQLRRRRSRGPHRFVRQCFRDNVGPGRGRGWRRRARHGGLARDTARDGLRDARYLRRVQIG
jgi:hypothetical protein